MALLTSPCLESHHCQPHCKVSTAVQCGYCNKTGYRCCDHLGPHPVVAKLWLEKVFDSYVVVFRVAPEPSCPVRLESVPAR